MAHLRRFIIFPVLAFALATTAGACTWRDGHVVLGETESPPPPRPQVTWVEVRHMVDFRPNQAELPGAEAGDIDSFLASAELGYGDRVVLTAASGAPLADRRIEAVRHYLEHRQVAVAIARRPQAPIGQDEIEIAIGRYEAVLPECPNWERALSGGSMSGGPDTYGCLTASARGAHAADPGDLLGGGPVGPADGASMARGVRDHRTGATQGEAASQSIRFVVGN